MYVILKLVYCNVYGAAFLVLYILLSRGKYTCSTLCVLWKIKHSLVVSSFMATYNNYYSTKAKSANDL